jgi:hypothetical protein
MSGIIAAEVQRQAGNVARQDAEAGCEPHRSTTMGAMGIRDHPEPLKLATWPTPVEPAPRLAEAVGLGVDDLWVKRDDLVGLGGGGNKVRKLERTCAAAMAAGARTLVTTGAAPG